MKCNKIDKKYLIYILNIFITIAVLYLLVFLYFILFSKSSYIEGLVSNTKTGTIYVDTSLTTDFASSFCNNNENSGAALNENCKKLTKSNCDKTNCCLWTSIKGEDMCVAGNKEDGPLFLNQ
jgi:hypothetical protein